MAVEKTLWIPWATKDGAAFREHLTADALDITAGAAPSVDIGAIVRDIGSHNCAMKSFAHRHATLGKLAADVMVLT